MSQLTLSLGAVSGPKGCVVIIQDALKKPWPKVPDPPKPVDVDAESTKATESNIAA